LCIIDDIHGFINGGTPFEKCKTAEAKSRFQSFFISGKL